MFLASLLLAITIKSHSSKFLLVEVEKEDNKDILPSNYSNRMPPIWYLMEPQMVDLKKYLQDDIEKCNVPNRLVEVQGIKAQKHFWVRGKEDRGAMSDKYGFDYYISRNKDDNQVPHLIRTMRGYTGGVCRLEFEPKRARLQSHCEKLFEENLLAACFEFTPKFGEHMNSWDPTNPIEVPSMNPNANQKWRNQKVAILAKEVCQPLIRLHWPKNLPRDIPRERLMMDIALALRATGPNKEVSAPNWTPYYNLVLAELARGADDMMIMTIPEFAKLFSHDVPTVRERVTPLNDMFTRLFKEPSWPDLFFCKCHEVCGELENKGDNFIRKNIRNLIAEFEAA